jgi:hypothetical protein
MLISPCNCLIRDMQLRGITSFLVSRYLSLRLHRGLRSFRTLDDSSLVLFAIRALDSFSMSTILRSPLTSRDPYLHQKIQKMIAGQMSQWFTTLLRFQQPRPKTTDPESQAVLPDNNFTITSALCKWRLNLARLSYWLCHHSDLRNLDPLRMGSVGGTAREALLGMPSIVVSTTHTMYSTLVLCFTRPESIFWLHLQQLVS